jgi:hypothetical protein
VWYILCSNLVKQANSNDRWSHQLKVIRGELRWALSFELWALSFSHWSSNFPWFLYFEVWTTLPADTFFVFCFLIVNCRHTVNCFQSDSPDGLSFWANLPNFRSYWTRRTTKELGLTLGKTEINNWWFIGFFFFLIQIDVVI